MSLIFPINAPITSDFGIRLDPFNGTSSDHWGIDFGAKTGTDVGASGDGVVIWEGTNKDFGNTVIIEHESGTLTLYAHLDKTNVKNGDIVSQGDIIGQVGNTGRSTGSHLHFETIDGNQMWNGAKLKDHIRWAGKQQPDKNGYKKIGIPGGIGRYNPSQAFSSQEMGYYIWFTQMDDRVRSTHMIRHGKVFSWNEHPIPGEEENCRCYAMPVSEQGMQLFVNLAQIMSAINNLAK